MKVKSFKQKVMLVLFGLLIAILLGEVFFRVGGIIAHELKVQSKSVHSNTYRILCIGDSTTFGIGASDIDKFSYPSQLQNILNEKFPDKSFEVRNLGMPGINSSQVVNRFKNYISEYMPNMVVVMVGINDPWNLEESNILKYYKSNNASVARKLHVRFELLLNRLRLYQFFKLVYIADMFKEPKIPPFSNETRSKGFAFSLLNPEKSAALHNSIINNITELKQIAENNHVNIIFMKYHTFGWGRPETIIHHAYTQLNVPIVDNELLFKQAGKIGLNVWANDRWHPNDTGYSLIAKNVYNRMVSRRYIDGDPVNIFEQ
jgi:lysophospholipase L1-like esterase